MSDYIRPDDHLEWRRFGFRSSIVSGENRRQISYKNGTLKGQIGELRAGLSRVSVLTISNPTLADSGAYVCTVMDQSTAISLEVMDSSELVMIVAVRRLCTDPLLSCGYYVHTLLFIQ